MRTLYTLPAIPESEKVIEIIDELIDASEYSMDSNHQLNSDDLFLQNPSEIVAGVCFRP
jgi:hypothetical protein